MCALSQVVSVHSGRSHEHWVGHLPQRGPTSWNNASPGERASLDSTWHLTPQILLPLSFIFSHVLIEGETLGFKMWCTNQFPLLQSSYSSQIWENQTRHKFNTGSSRTDSLLGTRGKRMLEFWQIITPG